MTTKTSFSDLRKKTSNFADLQKKLKEASAGKKDYKDDRFWFATQDKAGNGSAVIRFLPSVSDDSLPWVKIHSHSFQGPTGQWFIENCPTTIGKDCHVCTENGKLWNSGNEKDKEIVRKRKRKLSYIANIYVVNDPANPDNNGKTFLFKFGKKIFDKISEAMNPEFEDENAINVFDLWEGANFKLKITKKDGYANYDKSSFDAVAPLDKDDEKMEQIFNQAVDLDEFVAPSQFKSNEELKVRFDKVTAGEGSGKTITDDLEEEVEEGLELNDSVMEELSETIESIDDDSLDDLKALVD